METGIKFSQPANHQEKVNKQMKRFLHLFFCIMLFVSTCDISFKLIEATQINVPTNEQQQQQQQQQDLDNSIGGTQEAQLIQQASTRPDVAPNGLQTNLVAPSLLNAWIPVTPRRNTEEAWQLERRFEILEQELKKSLVLNEQTAKQSFEQQMEPKWTQITARLELMEKFITAATKKLYETEARVKQLEKCDCRLNCRWRPNETTTTATSATAAASKVENNYQNETKQSETTSLIKMDGQVWEHNCDVCSCHRGRVRCKHVTCPLLSCSNPQQIVGKCCPVCYKSCVYRNQTVKHGNKLVINSSRDTCKECMCIDGRFKCQRVELPEQQQHHHVRSHGTEREPLSWPQTSSTVPRGGTSNNNVTLQTVAATRQQRSTPTRDQLMSLKEKMEMEENERLLEEELQDEAADVGDEDNLNVDNHQDYDDSKSYSDAQVKRNERLRQIRRRMRSTSNTLPLVCPQIDCKLEDQIHLHNDCCTYCKNFDFCAQKAKHFCHPNAFCKNTMTNSSAGAAAAANLSATSVLYSEFMFSCHCKSGFSGDGQFCRDIDECSQKHLNDCDLKTTNCINLPGGYECRCKRGFKPILNFTLDDDSGDGRQEQQQQQQQQQQQRQQGIKVPPGEQFVTSQSSVLVGQTTAMASKQHEVAKKKSCTDINECSDAMLNKCHPQAKCINIQGSYKCRCKHGYLGNGFECHKWFSSDPNVAAYFHRHSPASSTSKQTTREQLEKNSGESSANPPLAGPVVTVSSQKVNMPIESFPEDPDEDQFDNTWATKAEPDTDEYDGDYDDNDNDEEEDDDDQQDNNKNEAANRDEKPPKLTESKWEPLKLVAESLESLSQFQQLDTNKTDQYLMDSRSTNTNNYNSNNLLQAQQNLNTRTMFFQPPPRFWHKENLTQQVVSTNSYDNILNQTISKSFIEANDKRNNGAQINSSPPSDSSNLDGSNQSLTRNVNHKMSPSSATPLYKLNDSPGYKRGTIITSAITSPTKGYGSKKAQLSSLSQHHKALGITSSSASPSSYLKIPRLLFSSQQHFNNRFNHILAKFDFVNSYPFWLIYLYLYLLGSQPYFPIILLSLIHIYIF